MNLILRVTFIEGQAFLFSNLSNLFKFYIGFTYTLLAAKLDAFLIFFLLVMYLLQLLLLILTFL